MTMAPTVSFNSTLPTTHEDFYVVNIGDNQNNNNQTSNLDHGDNSPVILGLLFGIVFLVLFTCGLVLYLKAYVFNKGASGERRQAAPPLVIYHPVIASKIQMQQPRPKARPGTRLKPYRRTRLSHQHTAKDRIRRNSGPPHALPPHSGRYQQHHANQSRPLRHPNITRIKEEV